MYILTVETHFGVRQYRFDDEQEALWRMRLWSKHTIFVSETVQKEPHGVDNRGSTNNKEPGMNEEDYEGDDDLDW